ncbi:MAG: hypothetical protein J0H22_09740, partial [Actinobacteria bacterium]|nr:hypothetical protein [Actinomycetota bacterium]
MTLRSSSKRGTHFSRQAVDMASLCSKRVKSVRRMSIAAMCVHSVNAYDVVMTGPNVVARVGA